MLLFASTIILVARGGKSPAIPLIHIRAKEMPGREVRPGDSKHLEVDNGFHTPSGPKGMRDTPDPPRCSLI